MNQTIAGPFNGQCVTPRWKDLRHACLRCLAPSILASVSAGCSIGSAIDVDARNDENSFGKVDYHAAESYSGAIALYNGALQNAAYSMSDYTLYSALTTDELEAVTGSFEMDADSRRLSSNHFYGRLQTIRGTAQYGRTALQRFPQSPRIFIGELYALEGYAEVLLAESMCSGIPLSKVLFKLGHEYTAGFRTAEVLEHAIALFDSAQMYAADSLAVSALARVGKARALLSLSRYAEAAVAVAEVPMTARYELQYTIAVSYLQHWSQATGSLSAMNAVRITDGKGGNGIDWIGVSKDSRIDTLNIAGAIRPSKYTGTTTSLRLADGIEARLIEAEADLVQGGNHWLSILNGLRATCTTASGCAPAKNVTPMEPLTDPQTDTGRVRLLFTERAFWMYLTGHRQGDLRRLVREYEWPVEQVYPWGVYPAATVASEYGTRIVSDIPPDEKKENYLFLGCFDFNP